MIGNVKTRTVLGAILTPKNERSWCSPDLFQKEIEKQLPKSIQVISLPPTKNNYNCFIFSLGFSEDLSIIKETDGFLYSNFIKHILQDSLIKILDAPQENSLVLYQDAYGEFSHSGIIQKDGTVISKWSWGPTLKHTTWDVPDFYGDKILYAKLPSNTIMKKIYRKYKKYNT